MLRPVLAVELSFMSHYQVMDVHCRVAWSHHLFYALSPDAVAILPDYSCYVDTESKGFSSNATIENIMSINVDSSLKGNHNIFLADSVLKSSSNARVVKRLFKLHSIYCISE